MGENWTADADYDRQYKAVLRSLDERSGTPPLIIGGIGVILHGSNRLTEDVDFACHDVKLFLTTVYEHGFKVAVDVRIVDGEKVYRTFPDKVSAFWGTIDRKSLIALHPVSNARIDAWFAPPIPYDELLADAEEREVEGLRLLVASPANLIRLKRIALAENPARELGSSDIRDIAFLERVLARRRGENPPDPEEPLG